MLLKYEKREVHRILLVKPAQKDKFEMLHQNLC
jgi:hypothetical protein